MTDEEYPMMLLHNCTDFKNWNGKQPERCKYGCFAMEFDGKDLKPRKCPHYREELTDRDAPTPVHPVETGGKFMNKAV